MNPRDRITAAMTAQEPGTPLNCIGLAKLAAMTEEQVLAVMTEKELLEEVEALDRAVERTRAELASWQRQLATTARHIIRRRWGVGPGVVVTLAGARYKVEDVLGYAGTAPTADHVRRLLARAVADKPALLVRREVRTRKRWATRHTVLWAGGWEVEKSRP